PFQDVRITEEEWKTLKNSTPFGHVPVLEVNGQPLPQSFAIFRYLASMFGMAGKTPFEAALVDALADQYKDYFAEIYPDLKPLFHNISQNNDTISTKEPARDKFFPILERTAKNNGSNGHFVGSSLTWVDLLIADHVWTLNKYFPDFLSSYPTVLDTVKKINATPRLKEWIANRK
ncbi:hypothetical protein PFISCL1PPCAC_27749, partial [Pristionchus fissidentatus]